MCYLYFFCKQKVAGKCCLLTLNDNLYTSFQTEPIFSPEMVLILITSTDISHKYERHTCMQFQADDIHDNNKYL